MKKTAFTRRLRIPNIINGSFKGMTLVEFTIVFPVLLFIIIGIIDLFTYLYLSNILEARAHRALEVATWVPGLDKAPDDGQGRVGDSEDGFQDAVQRVFNAALEGEISKIFSPGGGRGRARLKSTPTDIKVIDENINSGNISRQQYFSAADANSFAILLPPADGNGERKHGFKSQPIGIRINSELRPFLPFVPPVTVSGEAWGFRETYNPHANQPMRDCTGGVFNPFNPPEYYDSCNCGDAGVDPETGLCGCPEGYIWGRIPGKNYPRDSYKECICDVSRLNCGQHYVYDYLNCSCGQRCGGLDKKRDALNQCSCTEMQGDPFVVTEGCGTEKCVTVKGVELCSNAMECKDSNCPPGFRYSHSECGCKCEFRHGTLAIKRVDENGKKFYNYTNSGPTEEFTEEEVAAGICKKNCPTPPEGFFFDKHCTCKVKNAQGELVDPPVMVNENGWVLDEYTCTYKCDGRLYSEANNKNRMIVNEDGTCGCKPGYIRVKDMYSSGAEADCCRVADFNNCGANAEMVIGFKGGQQCTCYCKPGYCWDAAAGCVNAMVVVSEGPAAGSTVIREKHRGYNMTACNYVD